MVLTGAAGGIGRALATAFAGQGVRLIVTDRDAPALHRLAEGLAAIGQVTAIAADLGLDGHLTACAAAVLALCL